MPNIRTYQNTQSGFSGDNRGANSFGYTAQHLRQDYDSMGRQAESSIKTIGDKVVREAERSETSALAAKYAQTFESLTQSWNDTAKNSDPNDPDTGSKWREDVMRPALDELGIDLSTDKGRETYDRMSNQLQMHMFEKTTADQSAMAGDAAVSNINTMVNSYTNAVAADPSAMRGALPLLEAGIEATIASYPNLTAQQASELRTKLTDEGRSNIASAAAIGMIDRNPSAFREAAASGQFDGLLDAQKIAQLDGYADSQERAAVSAQKAAETELRRQQTEYVVSASNQIVAQSVDPNTGAINIKPDFFKQTARLALMPNAPQGLARAMLDFGATKQREAAAGMPAVTDPLVYQDFSDRMFVPKGTPGALALAEVYQARAAGLLSDKDFTFYKGAVGDADKDPAKAEQNKKLEGFFSGYKSTITKSNPILKSYDAPGDQQFYRFQVEKRQQFQAGIDAGKSPDDLLNPSSKDFIGRDVGQYTYSSKQAIDLTIGNATGKTSGFVKNPDQEVVKRLPGESAADYLKRSGG